MDNIRSEIFLAPCITWNSDIEVLQSASNSGKIIEQKMRLEIIWES